MAIPKITEQDIIEALKYIDENGVPPEYQSTKYELVTKEGKKYPPKYVIARADSIVNGTDITTKGFTPAKAVKFLLDKGFNVQTRNPIRICHQSII